MAEKLEDLNLPNAVVARIIKQVISNNISVGKDARIALGRAASVFVLYVTSAATNVAKKANRKTVTGQDVLDAMVECEFEEFVDTLKEQLEEFRKHKKDLKEKPKKGVEHVDADAEEEEDCEIMEDEEAT